jgi:flagellar export protein FliJ
MFAFRLERVLSVRRVQEETARVCHAEAEGKLREAREALAHLRERLTSALEGFDDLKRTDKVTGEALHLHTLHLAGLRRGIESARRRLAAAAAEAERTNEELSAAHKAKKSLERHREREETEWRRQEAQKEAKQADEIAVSRYRVREEETHGP